MEDLKKLTEETIKLVINNRFAPKSNKTNSVVQDDFINLTGCFIVKCAKQKPKTGI